MLASTTETDVGLFSSSRIRLGLQGNEVGQLVPNSSRKKGDFSGKDRFPFRYRDKATTGEHRPCPNSDDGQLGVELSHPFHRGARIITG